jgi:hypothetical protein
VVGIDRTITQTLLNRGVPVVGFDMPAYLKTKRTPDRIVPTGARGALPRQLGRRQCAAHRDARGASALTIAGATQGRPDRE